MNITNREITKDEHTKICEDFRNIEIEYNVPKSEEERLNITVDEDNEVVAFASGLINRKWFNLTDLWVHEKYRNQRLGSKILKMLEEDVKARGIEHIYTHTTGYNSNETFYEKQGYKQCYVFEEFFGVKNGHHICLRKDL